MKKPEFLLLSLLLLSLTQFLAAQPAPGDSLAILAKRIWAYTRPDDLTTRLGPFSYTGKQFLFLGEDKAWPDYFRVITPKGDTAYTLKKNLSADPSVDRAKLIEDIRNEEGDFAPGLLQSLVNSLFDWGKWYTYVWLIGWVVLLFFFWKYFYLLDETLNRLRKRPGGAVMKRWPVTWSALTGLVIGITMIFDSKEADWFFSEGIRVFAFYPSFWNYLWWVVCLLFFFLLVAMVVESIRHFGWLYGIIRSLVLLVVMNLYVFTGLLTGWIVAILLGLFLIFKLLAMGRGGGGPQEIEYKGNRYVRK